MEHLKVYNKKEYLDNYYDDMKKKHVLKNGGEYYPTNKTNMTMNKYEITSDDIMVNKYISYSIRHYKWICPEKIIFDKKNDVLNKDCQEYYYYEIGIKRLIGDNNIFTNIIKRKKKKKLKYYITEFSKDKKNFENQDIHTYYVGVGSTLYKLKITLLPIILGKEITFRKKHMDKIIKNFVNNDYEFIPKRKEKTKKKQLLKDIRKFDKDVNDIKISIEKAMSRNNDGLLLFRIIN